MLPTLACPSSRPLAALGRQYRPPVLRRQTRALHSAGDARLAHGSRDDTALALCLSQDKAGPPTTMGLRHRAAISQAGFPRQITEPLRVQQVRPIEKNLASSSCSAFEQQCVHDKRGAHLRPMTEVCGKAVNVPPSNNFQPHSRKKKSALILRRLQPVTVVPARVITSTSECRVR